MIFYNKSIKIYLVKKSLSLILGILFFLSGVLPPGILSASTLANLPAPGTMIAPTAGYAPTLIRGLTINPENPLHFDFIVDSGENELTKNDLEAESSKLIRYFLAALTTPEDEMWVNLSPYEKDRMISESFAQTEMGRDLLALDYILKQLSASLMYPENDLGQNFWNRVHQAAFERYGTSDIPLNTFNKIWIIPEHATVYEQGSSAFVIRRHLKVMLEEDYLAMNQHQDRDTSHVTRDSSDTSNPSHEPRATSHSEKEEVTQLSTQIIKEILIPEIEKEVNQGKNFAQLRQIYNSLILATWYKNNLKESLLGQVYVDQKKLAGIELEDSQVNQEIYDQYLQAFQKGVYNYIREDYDPAHQKMIPRQYFSGGIDNARLAPTVMAEEISAVHPDYLTKEDYILVDEGFKAWEGSPVHNVQVVIEPDGTRVQFGEGQVSKVAKHYRASMPKGWYPNVPNTAQPSAENFMGKSRTITDVISDKETAETKLETAQNHYNQLIADWGNLSTQIEDYETMLTNAQKQTVRNLVLEKSIVLKLTELGNQDTNLKKQMDDWGGEGGKIDVLRLEIEGFAEELLRLTQAAGTDNFMAEERTIEDVKSDIESKQKDLSTAKDAYNAHDTKYDSANQTLSELKSSLSEAIREEASAAAIAGIEAAISSQEQALKTLHEGFYPLDKAVGDIEDEIEDLNKELAALEQAALEEKNLKESAQGDNFMEVNPSRIDDITQWKQGSEIVLTRVRGSGSQTFKIIEVVRDAIDRTLVLRAMDENQEMVALKVDWTLGNGKKYPQNYDVTNQIDSPFIRKYEMFNDSSGHMILVSRWATPPKTWKGENIRRNQTIPMSMDPVEILVKFDKHPDFPVLWKKLLFNILSALDRLKEKKRLYINDVTVNTWLEESDQGIISVLSDFDYLADISDIPANALERPDVSLLLFLFLSNIQDRENDFDAEMISQMRDLFSRGDHILDTDLQDFIQKFLTPDGFMGTMPTTAISKPSSVGGIDFNPALLNLEIERDDRGFALPMKHQNIDNLMNVKGFFPIIINITPIANVPLILGFRKNPVSHEDTPQRPFDELGSLQTIFPLNRLHQVLRKA